MRSTSSPPPIDGRAGSAPQWRHPRDHKPRVDTTKGFTPSGPPVVHRETIYGTDLDTGLPVDRVILTLSNGETVVTDLTPNGEPMSRSTRFSAARAKTERKINSMFDTDLETGQITEFARVTSVTTEVDGQMTYGPAIDKTPDLVAPYIVAGHADDLPALVRVSTLNDTVTGPTPYQMVVPAHAQYGEIYIEGSNIRWTQDGSTPAPGNGEQERLGTTVKLYGSTALAGFRALAMDNVGNIDPSLEAKLTVSLWNANPERGPYSTTVPTAPTVSEIILAYAEGTMTGVNPNSDTFTFTFSAPLIAVQTQGTTNIGSWGPQDGSDYSDLHTQQIFDLTALGVTTENDAFSFTSGGWTLHLVGTDTNGDFHRYQGEVEAGSQHSFANVAEFVAWFYAEHDNRLSTAATPPEMDALVTHSFANGILTFDASASSMQWDDTGSVQANERNVTYVADVIAAGSVTNGGAPVAGTWVDVNGDGQTLRFDIADPSALNRSQPLVFDFSAAPIDTNLYVLPANGLVFSIDISIPPTYYNVTSNPSGTSVPDSQTLFRFSFNKNFSIANAPTPRYIGGGAAVPGSWIQSNSTSIVFQTDGNPLAAFNTVEFDFRNAQSDDGSVANPSFGTGGLFRFSVTA